MGEYGTGAFTQSGGTSAIAQSLYLDYSGSGGSTYNLSGNAVLSASNAYVGSGELPSSNPVGTSQFNQSGGTNTISASLYIGFSYGTTGMYTLSGNSLLSASNVVLADNDCGGKFVQSGGTCLIANTLTMGVDGPGCNATYELLGGLLDLSGLMHREGTMAFDFSGGTLRAGASFTTTYPFGLPGTTLPITLAAAGHNGTFDTQGYTVTLTGPISGPGGLVKTGSGVLVFSGSSSYGGDTRIQSGTLKLANRAALPYGTGKGNLSLDGTLDLNGFSAALDGLAGTGIGHQQYHRHSDARCGLQRCHKQLQRQYWRRQCDRD